MIKFFFHQPQIKFKDFFKVFFIKNPQFQLQEKLENYFKTPNIILTSSGRQAIFLILKYLKLKPNDEVIMGTFNCPTVPLAILEAGAIPIFADISPNGLNINIESLKKSITPQTKVVILSYIGNVPDVQNLINFCRERKIVLIEDCAQVFGAKFQKKFLGTLGDFGIFSFGISKNISSLGGGALVCQKEADYQKIKEIEKEYSQKYLPSLSRKIKEYLKFFSIPFIFNKYIFWIFSSLVKGYIRRRQKYTDYEFYSHITDLQTKIILIQLLRYEKLKKHRNQISQYLRRGLNNVYCFTPEITDIENAHLYLPVFPKRRIDLKKLQKIWPVGKLNGFGNFDSHPLFKKYKNFNTNEKNIQKKYFLITLDIPAKFLPQLVKDLKNGYSKLQ